MEPPVNIDNKAASLFGCFEKRAANTGIIMPETINE